MSAYTFVLHLEEFGSHILQTAYIDSFKIDALDVSADAKIDDFYLFIHLIVIDNHDIFKLKVSVDNLLPVAVVDGLSVLLEDKPGFLLL